MFDIGFLELLVVAVVSLLVLGPERLPQVIKKVASWTARTRHFANHLKDEFEREANLIEMRETLNKEKEQFRQHLKQFEENVAVSSSETELKNNTGAALEKTSSLEKSDSSTLGKNQGVSNE